jgi:hypothetical protein
MEIGDLLIRSSVRLAMICYAAVLVGCVLGRHAPAATPGSRWLWTLGCLLFWGHVLSAFTFHHHWSHAHAFADVAAQTKAALGVEFGYGIYVNHLFALVWTGDVLWSWLGAQSYAARPRSVVVGVHAFLLFIAVNGLIVFKSGMIRWASVSVLVGIAGLWAAMWAIGAPHSVAPQQRDGATSP